MPGRAGIDRGGAPPTMLVDRVIASDVRCDDHAPEFGREAARVVGFVGTQRDTALAWHMAVDHGDGRLVLCRAGSLRQLSLNHQT